MNRSINMHGSFQREFRVSFFNQRLTWGGEGNSGHLREPTSITELCESGTKGKFRCPRPRGVWGHPLSLEQAAQQKFKKAMSSATFNNGPVLTVSSMERTFENQSPLYEPSVRPQRHSWDRIARKNHQRRREFCRSKTFTSGSRFIPNSLPYVIPGLYPIQKKNCISSRMGTAQIAGTSKQKGVRVRAPDQNFATIPR